MIAAFSPSMTFRNSARGHPGTRKHSFICRGRIGIAGH
jgi:hypothetical protein